MTLDAAEFIRTHIERHGAVPFRWFMEQALYHPQHGYYAAGKAKIGRAGDFFTNVSVGPLFGRLLGAQFREVWERLDRPAEFTIVEQGAHDGAFACDVLTAAQPDFREAVRYVIVEPSPIMQERQETALRDLQGIEWRASLNDLDPFAGVVFANELLDAFPVHLVVFRDGAWRERHVDGELRFVDGPLSNARLADHLHQAAPPACEGYQTEVNLEALAWLEKIGRKCVRGCLLTIDYGYRRDEFYHPDRAAGTLAAYRSHRRILDPLERPGETDLTAHVEFTSLAERGVALGWGIAGFTDQHHFLVGLAEPYFQREALDAKTTRAFQTLMHPAMLGTAFKVLGLTKNLAVADPLSGFRYARDAETALGIGLSHPGQRTINVLPVK